MFERLVSILETGKAIAFVGAGASAPMYPLWARFIELLADHAVAEGKAEDKDAKRWKADTTANPQQRVNVILRKLGEPPLSKLPESHLRPAQRPGWPALHAHPRRAAAPALSGLRHDQLRSRAGVRPRRVAAREPQHRHAELGGLAHR
ncbi:MAG: hypothetical protein ACREXW_08425 [Gammaproteobacteria bacterium]